MAQEEVMQMADDPILFIWDIFSIGFNFYLTLNDKTESQLLKALDTYFSPIKS